MLRRSERQVWNKKQSMLHHATASTANPQRKLHMSSPLCWTAAKKRGGNPESENPSRCFAMWSRKANRLGQVHSAKSDEKSNFFTLAYTSQAFYVDWASVVPNETYNERRDWVPQPVRNLPDVTSQESCKPRAVWIPPQGEYASMGEMIKKNRDGLVTQVDL